MPDTIPTFTLSYIEILLIVLIVLIIYLIIRQHNVETFIETEALIKEGSFGIVEFILNIQTNSGKRQSRLYYNLDPSSAKLVQIDYNRFDKLKRAITSDQDYSKSVFARLFASKKEPDNIIKDETTQGPIILENVTSSPYGYLIIIKNLIRENLQNTITMAVNEKQIPVITYTIDMELKGNNYISEAPLKETMEGVGITASGDTVASEVLRSNQLEFGENLVEEPKSLKDVAINSVSELNNKVGGRKLTSIDIIYYFQEAVKTMDDFR